MNFKTFIYFLSGVIVVIVGRLIFDLAFDNGMPFAGYISGLVTGAIVMIIAQVAVR